MQKEMWLICIYHSIRIRKGQINLHHPKLHVFSNLSVGRFILKSEEEGCVM